ncbi:hypothetical protein OHA21_16475 [Actinoplanes sp. NBC_00393]|uniref:hypothetical protein n=1 Tax=Actinoplanes sp. NBC_00393 TaxID=2975953 RepID=UPI002E21EF19
MLVLRAGRGPGGRTGNLRVAELRRPPEHVAAKYARLEELAGAARTPGPRAEPAPHQQVEALRADPDVDYISDDAVVDLR